MKDFLTIIVVSLIFVAIFGAAINVGQDKTSNSRLSSDSVTLIQNISYYQQQNIDQDDFKEGENTLAGNNSNFDSEDTFSREFLESESSAQKKKPLAETITKIPDLVLISIGIPDNALSGIKWIIVTLIGVLLSFAAYRAFFGGGKVTQD